MKVINELRVEPALRDRYQVWLFMYPTGTPFPLSAARLRQALDDLRRAVDPSGADPALDRAVLIGHSMGGLISKMMVQESGDALWKLVAARPFADLRATPENIAMLKRVFFFSPHPSVRRVIFIATPHRGSVLGDQFIGRLTDRLIRLPNPLRATYRALLAQNGPEFFTPAIRAGLPSSIDELRRDSPLLVTLARLPVRPGVPCHSIIGRLEADGPLEDSSDSVVPSVSAHIDWAASERIVPGDHGCQDDPEAMEEIRRILFVHLDGVDREASAPLDPAARGTRPGPSAAPAPAPAP
jgi:pimeloyl-ACP methyl ester carboxylesterase